MSRFLLVFPPQQLETVVEEIKDQLARIGDHTVQQETNLEKGLARLAQQFDFLIVGSSLAVDRDSADSDGGGLEFCRRARSLGGHLMMLLAPTVKGELQRECSRTPGLTAYDDPQTAGTFALELLAALRGPAPVVEPCLDIRVKVSEAEWRFDMQGVGFDFRGNGRLVVGKATWMQWEAHFMAEPDWYREFDSIGQSIRVALCEENEAFRLQMMLGKMAAEKQLDAPGMNLPDRITFEVSERFYPLLLEAMFNPSMLPEPWLAQASSVSRRLLMAQAGRGDLFSGAPAMRRALVVCADTHGTAYSNALTGGQLKLKPLKCVQRECMRIGKLLARRDARTGVPLFYPGNVKVIGVDKPVSGDDIKDALRDGAWDLIHFAGHTHFQHHGVQQAGGTGFLFVGTPNEPEIVDFGDIVSYMREARFVYLSSCESGNSGFTTLAGETGINAVLGYRCQVNDRTAALQALLFYRALRRNHSLGSAFGQMRRTLYKRYRGTNNAWASAMLVMPECLS
jgi:hypothetical protein